MMKTPPQSNRTFSVECFIVGGFLALFCLAGGLGVYLIMTGQLTASFLGQTSVTYSPSEAAALTSSAKPTAINIPMTLPPGSALRVNGRYVGDWHVKVDKIVVAKSVTNPRDGRVTKATGRFALLFLEVTNLERNPLTFSNVEIQVADSEGNGYKANPTASLAASYMYDLPLLPNVQPNDTCSLVLAYDLPLSGGTYYLVPAYMADNGGTGIALDMPE